MGKWGLDYEFEQNPTLKIKAIKDRWIKAKHDLEDAKYVESLIHLDFIKTIKNYQTTWDYRLPTIKSAVDELKITDGRKKKPSLNCLNIWIKEDFFPEIDVAIKVNNIVSYGYEGYCWQMDFDINSETYSICVPNKKMIDSKNLSDTYEGKFAFMHRTGKSSISVEHTDYTEEDMAKFIKVYFDETGRKDNAGSR